MQFEFNFDIIGVTEMHLDKSVSDNDIRIDGMKTFREDQKKCKAGGCLIYCRNNLQVILRKDLSACELETIWVQPTSCRFLSFTGCQNVFGRAYAILG